MVVEAPQPGGPIAPLGVRPWAPRDEVAPRLAGPGGEVLSAASNGSEGCIGGWDLVFAPGEVGTHFAFGVDVRWEGVRDGFESTAVEAIWQNAAGRVVDWAPLWEWAPAAEAGWVRVHGLLPNVSGAATLVLRLSLRWSPTGRVCWRAARLEPVAPPEPRRLRLGAAHVQFTREEHTLERHAARFLEVCDEAGHACVDLLCLPEVILSWGMPYAAGAALYDQAVEVPGPWMEPFCACARHHGMAIGFSVQERAAELVHNAGVLIDADGGLSARYRKVHLAHQEVWQGVTPGREFPVAEIGPTRARVAMNICMDSSEAESSRVPARLGAEVLLLPIMGDHRSDGRARGAPRFDPERWLLIQRMRAMDNHLYLVAARNSGEASGVFGPDGSVLALGDGGAAVIHADVDLACREQSWSGAPFRDVTWSVRRESLYGALSGGTLPKLG